MKDKLTVDLRSRSLLLCLSLRWLLSRRGPALFLVLVPSEFTFLESGAGLAALRLREPRVLTRLAGVAVWATALST